MNVDPIYTPPPPPPPPPPPKAADPLVTAAPGADPAAGWESADGYDEGFDPFGGDEGFVDITLAAPAGPTGGGSQLVAIPADRAFVEQAFLEMFGHPVVTPEELAAARANPGDEHSKNVLWRQSLVDDNLKNLEVLRGQGLDGPASRRELLKGLMDTDEFKLHAGHRANNLKLGMPMNLMGPDGPMPFVWTSQTTSLQNGPNANYYGFGGGPPLDRPIGFEEGNKFLENFFCNGTSAYEMADTKLANTPQAKELARLGQDLYDAYWGHKEGDGAQQWLDLAVEKQAQINALVAQHPELKPRAAETQAVLAAAVPFIKATMHGGQATLLTSVPGGSTVGWYKTEPPFMNPGAPMPIDEVPEDERLPRYAQIGDYYAKQAYAQQAGDPTSSVGQWRNFWLT